jgi:thiamine-phosphate pyrophosphorylase
LQIWRFFSLFAGATMHIDPPILCLVSDGRARVTNSREFAAAKARLTRIVSDAAGAGVDLIQVRESALETSALVDLVAALIAITRGSSTQVVVNDRLDVALACGAAGVHLKRVSLSPSAARSMTLPGFLVGRSIHSRAEAVEHAPMVDYLIAGTVFPTGSKPTVDRLLGTSGLKDIVDAVRVPVLAIGGMTADRLDEVATTGVSGIAGISLFLNNSGRMDDVVAAVRARFDSVKAGFQHTPFKPQTA